MRAGHPPLIDGDPPELLVHDEQSSCPYLADQSARLPMRLPTRPLDRRQFAARLAEGDRRQGLVLYRPSCPSCQACEAIRILVPEFEENKTQRRTWRRGRSYFQVQIAPCAPAAEKVALYNLHKMGRGLLGDGQPIAPTGYDAFLVDSCTESFELRFFVDDKLVGVSVIDRADDALSAVYTYFDPAHQKQSPGVYSILTQIELCRRWNLRYLYLGLYVGGCKAMTYKADYRPHERLLEGDWQRFNRA